MKVIKDIVHGYIRIPKVYFIEIIDTEIFQRLRRIEQTSMRNLYPSARHDRFVHSLGTYFLGVKSFKCLKKNIEEDGYDDIEDEYFWRKSEELFSIACLLHDCGHAPFSHSFEYMYDKNKDFNVREKLAYTISGETFSDDYEKNAEAAPHEVVSAYLACTYFKEGIKKILQKRLADYNVQDVNCDIEFIVRCIIGCQYKNKFDKYSQFKNCFISLLNSSFFDVDKLDYIIRDSMFSGIDNTAIDLERLLNSLTIVEKNVIKGEVEGNIDGFIEGKIDFNFGNSVGTDVKLILTGMSDVNLTDIKGKLIFDKSSSNINNSNGQIYNVAGNKTVVENNTNEYASIEAIIDKSEIIGNVKGKIENKFMVDGYINGQVSGSFDGEVIGKVPDNIKGKKIFLVGFRKSGLSIIEDIILAKNRLYMWIYAHHKVVYSDYLLRNSLIMSIESDKDICFNKGLGEIISVTNLTDIGSNYYLVDDGDITSYIKRNYKNEKSEMVNEWLSRKYKYTVWKTFAEYNILFEGLSKEQLIEVKSKIFGNSYKEGSTKDSKSSSILAKYKKNDCEFVWIENKPKTSQINAKRTYIRFDKDIIRRLSDLTEYINYENKISDGRFFYLYSSKKLSKSEKNHLIEYIISSVRT